MRLSIYWTYGTNGGTLTAMTNSHTARRPARTRTPTCRRCPRSSTSLAAGPGTPGGAHLPDAALQLTADAGAARYVGGAPPAGSGVHQYYITVTALSVPKTGPGQDANAAYLGFSIAGQTLARATLICPTPAPAA
jgi:hypothetical protein